MKTKHASLAHDDTGGAGRLVVLLPGAGDLRSEYRFLAEPLAAGGYRVVTADLPGHGDSPTASTYTVAATAAAIIDLVERIADGPAVLVGTSFAPAAAVWAIAERPELFSGLVAVSPHLHADTSPKGRVAGLAIKALLRGPWAGALWARLYTGWYKANPPADLASETARMRAMLGDPARRRAVRETLTADRDGMHDRIGRVGVPSLVVFGSADDHFANPIAEAATVAAQLGGDRLIVDGAGHYPHVEQPRLVAAAVRAFVDQLA